MSRRRKGALISLREGLLALALSQRALLDAERFPAVALELDELIKRLRDGAAAYDPKTEMGRLV